MRGARILLRFWGLVVVEVAALLYTVAWWDTAHHRDYPQSLGFITAAFALWMIRLSRTWQRVASRIEQRYA